VDEVEALAGIDLAVSAGDFVTIVGSNGAGKSTLLDVVCGSQTPDSGRVVLDIGGDHKRSLTVPELVARFEQRAAQPIVDDTLLLSS
jgi:ABC-type uncharacterized transport system ATPase component